MKYIDALMRMQRYGRYDSKTVQKLQEAARIIIAELYVFHNEIPTILTPRAELYTRRIQNSRRGFTEVIPCIRIDNRFEVGAGNESPVVLALFAEVIASKEFQKKYCDLGKEAKNVLST
jgi:hypothetical protein